MGLISRVSSRTYREKNHTKMETTTITSLQPPQNHITLNKTHTLRVQHLKPKIPEPPVGELPENLKYIDGPIKCLEPVNSLHAPTKNSMLLAKSTRISVNAEDRRRKILEAMYEKSAQHVLVPTWEYSELVRDELLREESRKDDNSQHKLNVQPAPTPVSELPATCTNSAKTLNAKDHANLEIEHMRLSKINLAKKQKIFDKSLRIRVNK